MGYFFVTLNWGASAAIQRPANARTIHNRASVFIFNSSSFRDVPQFVPSSVRGDLLVPQIPTKAKCIGWFVVLTLHHKLRAAVVEPEDRIVQI